jgi:predicted DNA-binding transcriptional regulator AlpA
MTERPIPVVALRAEEAAEALGVSRDWFDQHVRPEVPHIRRGRMTLYAVKALEKWAEANMERA